MLTFLTILQVLACFILVTTVLLQPSKGGAAFSPSTQSTVGNSGGTNFLFKTTMVCAIFLAASSLFMTWSNIRASKASVIDQLAMPLSPDMSPATPPAAGESPVTTAPAEGSAP
jgi:protein translocase SecG subunit